MTMEDPNALAVDCIVISCCCQCLILQLLIFLLLKLPWKIICKTRDFAKRRLRKTGRSLGNSVAQIVENHVLVKLYSLSSREGSSHGSFRRRRSGGACLEEVDKVLEELSQQGQFGFGSFWGQSSPDQMQSSPCQVPPDKIKL
ncbi:hypothetical protein QQ045_019263 [Rhodiola kirilowii]